MIPPRKIALTPGNVIAMAATTLRISYVVERDQPVRNFFVLGLFIYSLNACADPFEFKLYSGGLAGYGSTTWQGLVPSEENQNAAISMSAPIRATEGGVALGAFVGYEFSPFFALEFAYTHFPDAIVDFDNESLFAFDHEDNTELKSRTDMLSAMAKIMLIIPKTFVRVYSGAGVANIHRNDEINNQWRIAPTFGLGINYDFTPHFMAEISTNYTTGYGEAEISPVNSYIPFLYSAGIKLAYKI